MIRNKVNFCSLAGKFSVQVCYNFSRVSPQVLNILHTLSTFFNCNFCMRQEQHLLQGFPVSFICETHIICTALHRDFGLNQDCNYCRVYLYDMHVVLYNIHVRQFPRKIHKQYTYTIYAECRYTCKPCNFEIPALRFPRKDPVNPCKHLQCASVINFEPTYIICFVIRRES